MIDRLQHDELVTLFAAVGVLLLAARLAGEGARRLGQPAVLGELLAGIILGPTILGNLAPGFVELLFPATGPNALVLDGLTTLAIALFLLVAGMEVDLSNVWRQGRPALSISVIGILVPFGLGFAAAWAFPRLLGMEADADRLIFALFIATALSISALPVIAKTLLDLGLFRTDLGMIVMPAAVLQDVIGWCVFAVVLGMMGAGQQFAVSETVILTLTFAVVILTVGRWLIDRLMPYIQAHFGWPGGVIGFALSLALLGAAFTEWIGVHAIFGAFFVGIAVGDSHHLREETRFTIDSFISYFFAPIFFASIGLRVDFAANFDLGLVIITIVIATAGKLLGCMAAARLAKLGRRESWAIAFAMNARGAMEIILGLLALQFGVISERLFVALVIMALFTSIISGPLIQRVLQREKVKHFTDYLKASAFIPRLESTTRRGVIAELVGRAVAAAGLADQIDEVALVDRVLERERLMATGMGEGVALPHARIPDVSTPVVAMGLSEEGIDFNAPDGKPAHIVLLTLVPTEDDGLYLHLLGDVARTFADERVRSRALSSTGYTELLATVKVKQETRE